MSPKRLLWTGLFCIALSVLTAALGLVAQAGLVVMAILMFHISVSVPLIAAHGAAGEASLSIPRVLPMVLVLAWLFFAVALGCLFESGRRALGRRRLR
jgi:hypothetical protein